MDKKFFLLLIICALAIVAWYQFYEITQSEIWEMKLETRRLRGLEQEISALKVRHRDLTAFAATNEQLLNEARILLPVTPAQNKFIDELYRTAENNHVWLTAVQSGEVTAAEEIQSQLVHVSIEADYISTLNFIREILDGGRLVSLENFSAVSGGNNVITCELTFKIFAAPSNLSANKKTPD